LLRGNERASGGIVRAERKKEKAEGRVEERGTGSMGRGERERDP